MANEAKVVVTAIDQATEVINRITGGFSSVQAKWASLVGALGIGAGATALTALVKSSIEAADNMGDLAAKVGIGVETLSKYKLAADASGTSLEGLANGIKRLSIGMLDTANGTGEAQDAFRALGISVTDASGNLRSADDVLLDVADAFAATEDGTAKTALAMKIFGKAGADLIPFLNNGRDGLQEFADTAEALGLVLDSKTVAAADRTNDMFTILGQVATGFGNRVMKEVLPTLEGLASQLLDAAKNSGALEKAAQGVSAVFKTVVSVGIAAYNTLQAVGGALGGIVAAVVQAVHGNFKGAWETVKTIASDTKTRMVTTAEQIGAVWTESLGTVDNKTVALAKSFQGLTGKTGDAKKTADEYAKSAKVVQDLLSKSLGVSGDYVDKLKALELWYSRNRDKTEEYRRAVEALISQQDSSKRILKEQEEAEKAVNKALEDARIERERSIGTYNAETQKIREKASALELEARMLGLTKEQQAALTAEQRAAEIVRLQALATSDMVLLAGQEEVDSINARIESLQRLNAAEGNLAAKGAMVDAAKATRVEWDRTSQQIEQALTDALVQGFTNGKSIAKSIGDWIKNYFLTNVARSIAQALTGAIGSVLGGVANATGLGGLAGLFGGGSSAGGAGNVLNLGSLASSILGGGSSFLAGVGSTLAGNASMAAFSGLLANGSFAAAAGMAAPYLLPVIAGIAALSGILGNDRSPAQQVFSNIGPGDIGYGRLATNPTGANYDEVVRPIVQSVEEIVGKLGGTSGNTTYGLFTSASPDNLGAQVVANVLSQGSGNIFYTDTNASNESMQQRIAEALPQMLLAGLKDANIPEEFASYFRDLQIGTATAQQINDAIAAAVAAKDAQDSQTQRAEQATIETAANTSLTTDLLQQQVSILQSIGDGITRLIAVTAEVAARPVNVQVMVPEVNGGLT